MPLVPLVPLVPLALVRRSGPEVAAPLEGLAEEAPVPRGAKAEGLAVGEAAPAVVGPAVREAATAAAAAGEAATVEAAVGAAATAVMGLVVVEAALGKDPAAVVPEAEGAAQGPLSII